LIVPSNFTYALHLSKSAGTKMTIDARPANAPEMSCFKVEDIVGCFRSRYLLVYEFIMKTIEFIGVAVMRGC
jgi:hypothetical protein